MSWTDERVDTLKRLWTEGLSASQIAKQLGGVSRNAVIGKVHRLGLEGRAARAAKAGSTADNTAGSAAVDPVAVGAAVDAAVEAPAGGDPGAVAATAEAADNVTPIRQGEHGDEPVSEAEPEAAPGDGETTLRADNDAGPAADHDPESDIVVPVPRKLKLVQLTERTCKWPIGDPMHDDFHFCGHEAEEGRPYCEYHSGLAFQPASERRRVR